MNDSSNAPRREPITDSDVSEMLAADGKVLLALVLMQILATQPDIFDNAGGGARDLGRQLRGAALDQLMLMLIKASRKKSAVSPARRAV